MAPRPSQLSSAAVELKAAPDRTEPIAVISPAPPAAASQDGVPPTKVRTSPLAPIGRTVMVEPPLPMRRAPDATAVKPVPPKGTVTVPLVIDAPSIFPPLIVRESATIPSVIQEAQSPISTTSSRVREEEKDNPSILIPVPASNTTSPV